MFYELCIKGRNAGQRTVQSIWHEKESIMMFIFGVTSDKFGEKEAKEILKECDKYAITVNKETPSLLNYPSSLVYIKS